MRAAENIVTFIQSEHVFDYNGKEYKLMIKSDRSVRLYDSFSGRELLFTDAAAVYPEEVPASIHEAFFIHHAIEEILR